MNILDKIIEEKKKELSSVKRLIPVASLEKRELFNRDTISLSKSLIDTSSTGIIAEFKRRSPSKGIINSSSSVADVTTGYFNGGASAISVLTESHFFNGSVADLIIARASGSFPLLRKDFTIDEYQVIESKAIGADAVLLIAAVLTSRKIFILSRLARSLGLEVILEIHEPSELMKLNNFINIVGVNNRNLKSFTVDIGISVRLASQIPDGFLKISESGISSVQAIRDLKNAGYNGYLIGEKFMSDKDPVTAFSQFVKDLK